ncbi:hypothetical protein AYI70_g4260 [Smittium culicis]|uniref:Uncharacterized protein n=1 Tax=Smittium culicis TaxID=133412 RepID=A0A1R1Y065_9FUNG|nr:hypothetical protein AYI70_g4260 [Smittium culicis]
MISKVTITMKFTLIIEKKTLLDHQEQRHREQLYKGKGHRDRTTFRQSRKAVTLVVIGSYTRRYKGIRGDGHSRGLRDFKRYGPRVWGSYHIRFGYVRRRRY